MFFKLIYEGANHYENSKKNIDDTAIYQTKNGAITLKKDVASDMLWASQNHIAEIFEVERSVVTKYIRNIMKDKELDEKSVRAKLAHTAEDGKTYQVQFYSLDVILAVGYRVNSKRAIAFRQWATKTLKEHINKGFTINRKRIQNNYAEFLRVIEDVKALIPSDTAIDHNSVLELVTLFAETWFSLDAPLICFYLTRTLSLRLPAVLLSLRLPAASPRDLGFFNSITQ